MRQRAMIAIAIACDPQLLIADEPTTALDVTIQAQILELLRRLRRDRGMAIVLISHDLGVVAEFAQDVAVMYAGRVVERAAVHGLFAAPLHPYTAALLAASPRLDRTEARLAAIDGAMPDLVAPPAGCRFHPRCTLARPACSEAEPPLRTLRPGHAAACIRHQGYRRDGPVATETVVTVTPAAPAPGTQLRAPAPRNEALLEVVDLAKHFTLRKPMFGGGTGAVRAVDGVSFTIARGETLALVGESGCGKSTTGRLLLRLIEPTRGRCASKAATSWRSARELRAARRDLQMVFQDPYASLSPRMTVGADRRGAAGLHGIGARPEAGARAWRAAAQVGLRARSTRSAIRTSFSGGQRQRIGIARALALNASFIVVCDEPVSALDVSVQAQIVNLLQDLQARIRAHLSVHQPRPRGGAPHRRPRRGDVSRPHRRDRGQGAALRRSAPSLHPGAALGRAASPIPTRRAGASCSRATCRARWTRRAAVASTPAARDHVETGAEQPSACERSDQRLLVDDRASADIDHDPMRGQRSERRGVDQMARRGTARSGDGEVVADRRQGADARGVAIGDTGLLAAAAIGDRHAEAFRAARDRAPDAAKADDAQALAREAVQERVRRTAPLAVCDEAMAARRAARDVEQQRHRHVGDAVGADAREIGDRHAACAQRREVESVVADPGIKHEAQARECRQPRFAQGRRGDRDRKPRAQRRGQRRGLALVLHRVQLPPFADPLGEARRHCSDDGDLGRLVPVGIRGHGRPRCGGVRPARHPGLDLPWLMNWAS
jgi:oligopeptide/dipeptide ABC transporter ATP-binding protein